MKKGILMAALIVSALALTAIAPSKDDLVGTWKLISSKDMTEKGEVKDSYGRNPAGFLTYTADGRMTVIITNDGRKPLSVPDWISSPAEERRKHSPQASPMRGVTHSRVTK